MYLFDYQDIIREKILQYKFQEKTYIYHSFAKIIANDEKICRFLKSYDIIIPVPISKKRKQKRAKHVPKLDYQKDVLYKIKDTSPQSILDKENRQKNIQGAYYIKNEKKVQNKKILLFDDIYTTGATVNECSRTLKQVGAKEIGVLTLAKD